MSNVIPFDRRPDMEDDEPELQPWEKRNESCESCPVTHQCQVGKPSRTFTNEEWMANSNELDRLVAIHGLPDGCPNRG